MSPIFTGSKFGFGRVDAAAACGVPKDTQRMVQSESYQVWASNGSGGNQWGASHTNPRANIDTAGNLYSAWNHVQGNGYLKCTFTPTEATSILVIRCFIPFYGETGNHSDHTTFFLYKYTGADSNISAPALNVWKCSDRYEDNPGNDSLIAQGGGNHIHHMSTFVTVDDSKQSGARTYQLRGGCNSGAVTVSGCHNTNPSGGYLKPTQANIVISEILDSDDVALLGTNEF